MCSSQPVRSCSPDLIPCRHVRSDVPDPWYPAARPDTSYACWNCCSLPARSCSPIHVPLRHARYHVPCPWDPAAPSWYPICMYDLVFWTREILQPRPDTSFACWICGSIPVRSCSPVLIPCRHVLSVVPNPEILQPYPDILYACTILFSEPVRSCNTIWHLIGTFDLLFRAHQNLKSRPDTSLACSIWCLEPVRSCSPELIPRRRIRSSMICSSEPVRFCDPSIYL